jgi:glycerol-3-phosphate acyltransferase PlsY
LGERLGEGALTIAFTSHHSPQQQFIVLLVAVAAVLGHVFPIYLRFRGGKGVATTIGVTLGVYPYYTYAMLAALVAYFLVRYVTGKVSAGSVTLAVVFPAAFIVHAWVTGLALAEHWPLLVVAILLALVIIVRHRENIRRLIRGEEIGVAGQDSPAAPKRP